MISFIHYFQINIPHFDFYNMNLFFKNRIRSLGYLFRKIYFFWFFKQRDILIGRNLIVRGGVSKNKIGKGLIVYDNVIFESHNKEAELHIGDNCILSYGTIISCSIGIKIGNNVWVGEYSSVRDSTHVFNTINPMGSNLDMKIPISIGNNVWIGRNTIIMPGSIIEDNVIIGANSMVKGLCRANAMYAGTPAKLKKCIL